jgi:hypothetical protein
MNKIEPPLDGTPKLCKDCQHFRPFRQRILFWTVTDQELARCAAVGLNLVTGAPKKFCDIEREYGDACGKAGKLWKSAT